MDSKENEEELPETKPLPANLNGVSSPAKASLPPQTTLKLPFVPPERTEEEEKVCRNYIWGNCDKPASECRFEHVRNIVYMKKVLQFCHDFQNHGCSRTNCTYLHTSKEEEKAFLNDDKIPQILLDRYAKIEAKLNSRINNKPKITKVVTPTQVPNNPPKHGTILLGTPPQIPPKFIPGVNPVPMQHLPIPSQHSVIPNQPPPVTPLQQPNYTAPVLQVPHLQMPSLTGFYIFYIIINVNFM